MRQRDLSEKFAAWLDAGAVVEAQPDAQLGSLVSLARQLGTLSGAPPADFRADLRRRLVEEARTARSRRASLASLREGLWGRTAQLRHSLALATATALTLLIVGTTAVFAGGSRSLPGQPLHSLKRGVERIQLAVARGDLAKGKLHLAIADTRLREIAELVGAPKALPRGPIALGMAGAMLAGRGGADPDTVIDTLALMNAEVRAGSRLLIKASKGGARAEPLQILRRFTASQIRRLEQLKPSLPPSTATAADASLTTLAAANTDASNLLGLCGACVGEPSPEPQPVAQTPGTEPGPPSAGVTGSEAGRCKCAQPSPEPSPSPTSEPTSPAGPTPAPSPTPTGTSRPTGPLPPLPPPLEPVGDLVNEVVNSLLGVLPSPLPIPQPLP
ncbi:MAG: DUF5667 domain-containing protein [Actinomycetota bacterium]